MRKITGGGEAGRRGGGEKKGRKIHHEDTKATKKIEKRANGAQECLFVIFVSSW
jgi:hypothetical protein